MDGYRFSLFVTACWTCDARHTPPDVLRVAPVGQVLHDAAPATPEVMVRRSERALGQAIRDGQERGEIARPSQAIGRVPSNGIPDRNPIPRPTDYLGASGQVTSEVYALTDDVTDAEFETALDRAQTEQNVSRANVVRKVREVQTGAETQQEKWARVTEMADRGQERPSAYAPRPPATFARWPIIGHLRSSIS